ncbi:hypothetical protein CTEN210_17774 [Chaetoceros tenuissimus]|uniref:MYND-type domain-containing protein n=1 Tax=Chaetoceros tenuissimus TaxID=426638 RepID=A0AAD3DBF1_9STRA|nr:hypothetical protein CTEN210_17774 [Chaetoceros tenuissimus]
MSSTKTTTTKKSNDGSCAACNKEGAVLRCAPCRDAGVDVFFCSRECQVKQWKIHKVVCKKTSTTKPKKEESNVNKEAKQEGKKELQHKEICGNCFRTFAEIGSNLSMCSKCNKSYYCSRECQVEDWPRHKSLCKHNFELTKDWERSFDSSGMNIHNLFQKWDPTAALSAAVYPVLKKKGIKEQPPVKVVIMKIEFNYNAQTFIVAEVPRAVAIADLSQKRQDRLFELYKDFITKTAGGVDQVYAQFAIVSTKELGQSFENIAPVVFNKSKLDQMNAGHIDMHEIRNVCAGVRLKSGLFRGWKSIRRRNLQKQMEQMKPGHSYTVFVQNALQLVCNKSLRNTHRIVVYVKMGKEIGQISQLSHYLLAPIVDFKICQEECENFVIRMEDIESRSPTDTDIAIETLFVDTEVCFAFEYTVYCGVNDMQNKTAKQCKKGADKHFRKLQQSVKDTPSDLLEKVSL